MNVLIVYAHPEPASFNRAMKDFAVEVLEQAGHAVKVSDLYAMKFEAEGGPDDFLERANPERFDYLAEQTHAKFSAELQGEMDKLMWCDLVIFQFPLWWFSLPAILKGWVDRVFAVGFAYDRARSYETGVFRGKRAMLSFTTGAPPTFYVDGGRHGDIDTLILHIQRGMLYYVGMDVVPPFIAYGAARVAPDQRAGYLEAYRQRLETIDQTAFVSFAALAAKQS